MLQWEYNADIYMKRNVISISAKKCALIAVDEIIYVLDQYIDPVRRYWEEVKLEIQKL